ncbi:MAG TPA: hypothetical protein VGM56_11595 [Byssovorax sp.]
MQESFLCPFCNARTHVPGLRTSIACDGCARTVDLVAHYAASRTGGVRYAFGGYYDVLAEAVVLLADGEPLRYNLSQQARSYWRRPPACAACQAPFGVDPRAAIGGMLACARCGEATPVRAPDDETRAWDPRLSCVVGDARLHENRVAVAPEGTTIPCGQCGAPLAPDGKRRATACAHCGAANFLGDAAWRALHPTAGPATTFLVYDVDAALEADLCRELLGEVGEHHCFDAAQRARIQARSSALTPRANAASRRRAGVAVVVAGVVFIVAMIVGVCLVVVWALSSTAHHGHHHH